MLEKLKNLVRLPRALFWAIVYQFPAKKLKVIGVTGTDGKTTTVYLIHHLLKTSGQKVSMVSSLGAVLAGKEVETGLHVTTPDPAEVQRLLSQAVRAGAKYFVVEATSHGLVQQRLWGIPFSLGVVTNVTHEHLDYHKSWQKYLEAKARLFKGTEFAILNRDDASFNYLKRTARGKIITYGIKNKADFQAGEIDDSKYGLRFSLKYGPAKEPIKIKSKLQGEFNVYNLLAAAASASVLGLKNTQIKKGLESFTSVPGRMEAVNLGQDFSVMVDFAHTPNGLRNVLTVLRKKLTGGRLIAVFGSAGLRDRGKRPMMGEIAAKLADMSVLTAEDPRTEDVGEIIEEIAAGSHQGGAREYLVSSPLSHLSTPAFIRIPDRRKAIEFAITRLAKKGDIVALCGKGREKSIAYGRREKPWDEVAMARKALEKGRANDDQN